MGYRPRFPYKNERKESWWFHWIRYMTWFSFRYWWVVLGLFFLTLFVFFCWCNCWKKSDCVWNARSISVDGCCECNATPLQDTANITFRDTIPKAPEAIRDTIPKAPEANCRVHFSGLIMGGEADLTIGISKIYEEDFASEYVGSGYYPNNNLAFPKAVSKTFDGIAIDKGTRLIIYSSPNFKGTVLLDVEGPLVINNSLFKDWPEYSHCNSDTYPPELQVTYPQSKRIWSTSDMQKWSSGSCKIICSNK